MHPYKDISNYQHWMRSFRNNDMRDIDPMGESKFKIQKTDKIMTAGSCFAQHIARRLELSGYNYYVSEDLPSALQRFTPKDVIEAHNYRTYSARYGNIYTPRQLVQLFMRAYGIFNPTESYWSYKNGVFVDPFRPQIQPGGYASVEELEADRLTHFQCVREAFTNADVFVFTLGLTEAFASAIDGAIFPIAPGVAGGEYSDNKYSFVNFDVNTVYQDLELFYKLLKTVNSECKIIVTVSPVPLMATKENRHVLVSTTYSKSVLRVCCDMFERAHDDVLYFPSYEIITGNFNSGSYFESDFRSVKEAGVDHVMHVFLKRLTTSEYSDQGDASRENLSSLNDESSIEHLAQVACDEELLRNI